MLPRGKPKNTSLPTPIVTAGIGLLFSGVIPGGFSAGRGFLLGLFGGFILSAIVALPIFQRSSRPFRCPNCGARLSNGGLVQGPRKGGSEERPHG